MPIEDPVLPPLVEPLPVDEPLPMPPGVPVVLEPEPVDEPLPVEPLPIEEPVPLLLPDVPPAALELPWSRRHWSFCRPVSESQLALPEVEPAEEPPEFIAPLPPLVLEPPMLEPLVPPALEPVEPPTLEPLEPPTLLPDAPPALPPVPPPDCAYAVIAKRAAAVAVTKSFNFMFLVLL